MLRPQSIHLFANPTAGRQGGAAAIDALAKLVRTRDAARQPLLRTWVPESVEAMRDALAESIGCNPDFLVVAGGDGTQRLAAEMLARGSGSTILAPLRCGTGNGLADALALPRNPEAFADLLFREEPSTLRLRLATTDRGPLLHTLGAGLDASMVRRLARTKLRLPGRAAWSIPVLGELCSGERHQVRLRIDGDELGVFEQVMIPRFPNHGGALHLPGPIGRDPERLDVVAFRRRSRIGWAIVALRGACRRLRIGRDLEYHTGTEIELEPVERNAPVHLDGDPFGTTPIRIAGQGPCLELLLGETNIEMGQ